MGKGGPCGDVKSVTGAGVCVQHCPVVLTDHNEEVLSVLERNAALHRDGTSHGEALESEAEPM